MATDSKQPTADDLKKEVAEMKKRAEQSEARAKALEEQIEEAAKAEKAPLVNVKGKAVVKLLTDEGEEEVTVTAKRGQVRMRLVTGEIVGTEAMFRIANGGKPTDAELLKYPALSNVTKATAGDVFAHVARLGANPFNYK